MREKIIPRLPRGFIDKRADYINQLSYLQEKIAHVYQLYGFEQLETPIFEYSEVLGKFLPDHDRPNAGVFSFQDDDEQWLSLRYDLTAPLARYVAENFETLPKPYRSYRMGSVFRNEKPGPGRFRQFLQFDADVIGAASVDTDCEICMLAVDALKNLGFTKEEFVIRFNNRKLLDSILIDIGLLDIENIDQGSEQRLTVLRAIDKWDKFGKEGVFQLLQKGRLDESGDFTKGAQLEEASAKKLIDFLEAQGSDNQQTLDNLYELVKQNSLGEEAISELRQMDRLAQNLGYSDFLKIDPSIVRGLEYYTGPVFEACLLTKVKNEKGQDVVFGSVGGGGRYDDLITRFRKENLPSTGFSIGMSRLMSAMQSLGKFTDKQCLGPVIILVMDRDDRAMTNYYAMGHLLRENGIRAEVYAGSSAMKAQMKYADRRHAPCVIIQGSREREEGNVEIKDLIQGMELAKKIDDNKSWRQERPAQMTVKQEDLLPHIKKLLESYQN